MPIYFLLYISLAFLFLGLIYKVSGWFRNTILTLSSDVTPSVRFFIFIESSIKVFFSKKILRLISCLILDVFLQVNIFRGDYLKWIMHMCICGGFIMLLLMHALGDITSAFLFADYYSTMNPFFFLRDLFGFFVIAGVGIAVYRRGIRNIPRLKTNLMDGYALAIIALIILSGFILEGSKITSHKVFMRMVADYADLNNEDDVKALESYWVKELGLASNIPRESFKKSVPDKGKEIHELNCLGCHSDPHYAFGGYLISRSVKPISPLFDSRGLVEILYYVHIILCFIGLSYLPFSKMFHIIATPICLLANSIMDTNSSLKENISTRQIMELDACTHCGNCSLNCSAMMAYEAIGNNFILPSEKMVYLKRFISGHQINIRDLRALQEGVYICTNCDRCTVVCPSGINLKDLWTDVRTKIFQMGIPEPLILSPFSFVRGLKREELKEDVYSKPLDIARGAVGEQFKALSDPTFIIKFPLKYEENKDFDIMDDTFAFCFGCQNCTTVCPVVNTFDSPQEELGLLPHQIMRCLGLGLLELARGPNMLWDCVTCYQCQEYCPQGVKVADLLYGLKNASAKKVVTQISGGQ